MSEIDNPFPGEYAGNETAVAEPAKVKKAVKKEPPPDKDRWAITKHYRKLDGPFFDIRIMHLWSDNKTGAHYRVNIYKGNMGKPVSSDQLVESEFVVCRNGEGNDKNNRPNRVIHSINGCVLEQPVCNEPTVAPV